MKVCSIEGCGPLPEGKKLRRGMCQRHYQAMRKAEGYTKPKQLPRHERVTLPVEPLLAYAERRGVHLSLQGERIKRDTVDDIACKTFRVHPSFIYGLDWDRVNAA